MTSPGPAGRLFVISAPSGVGKTTLVQSLLREMPTLRFSISSTTRSSRSGETDGKDYHFISRQAFQAGIQANRFLEWAQVHGEYYGTDRAPLDHWLTTGDNVLLDIDVQGARQVRQSYPQGHFIFILPPAWKVLVERLQARGTESPRQITARLTAAYKEVQEARWYDYLVVNDVLQDAAADLSGIVRAARCRRQAQAHHLEVLLAAGPPA